MDYRMCVWIYLCGCVDFVAAACLPSMLRNNDVHQPIHSDSHCPESQSVFNSVPLLQSRQVQNSEIVHIHFQAF